MLIIGLCGGSGSGKGAACEAFRSIGIPSVDTDAVYHSLTSGPSACLSELAFEFGEEIIRDGSLDRRRLADIVFSPNAPKDALPKLNAIAHKHILARTWEIVEAYRGEGKSAVVIDAPLLFESGLDADCDVTVAIIADFDKRIERIMRRDGISEEGAMRRISKQISDHDLILRANHVIRNNGTVEELAEEVGRLAEKLLPIGQ